MVKKTTATKPVRLDDDAVLMYPDNQLGEQKCDYEHTQSAFSVVRERFFSQEWRSNISTLKEQGE